MKASKKMPGLVLQFANEEEDGVAHFESYGSYETLPLVGDRVQLLDKEDSSVEIASGIVTRRYFTYDEEGLENVMVVVGGKLANFPYQRRNGVVLSERIKEEQ